MSPKTKKNLDSIVAKLRALKPKYNKYRDQTVVDNYFGHLRYRGDQIAYVYKERGLEVLALLRKTALELHIAEPDPYHAARDCPYRTNLYRIGSLMTPSEVDNDLKLPELRREIALFLNGLYSKEEMVDKPEERKEKKKKKKNKKNNNNNNNNNKKKKKKTAKDESVSDEER